MSDNNNNNKDNNSNNINENTTTATTTDKNKKQRYSTPEEFDALQDQEQLQQCLNKIRKTYGSSSGSSGSSFWSKRDGATDYPCNIEMYQLPGCPYCAKVSAILDYYKVPYTVINVDTLKWSTYTTVPLPRGGYGKVPQLQLVTNPEAPWGDTARGPFIGDSDFIVKKLAPVLGYQSQIDDPRVQASLARLDPYIKTSFTYMAGSPGNAMILYCNMVAPHYQWLPMQLIGATVLTLLTCLSRKPKKKLTEQEEEFLEARPEGKPFHGGDKPDIVDIQMYGVSRNVLRHSVVARRVLQPPLYYDWVLRMMERMPIPYGRQVLNIPPDQKKYNSRSK